MMEVGSLKTCDSKVHEMFHPDVKWKNSSMADWSCDGRVFVSISGTFRECRSLSCYCWKDFMM